MTKTVKLPLNEYKELVNKYKMNMRFESPQIDSIMKTITVQGPSGPGFKFKNEYERLMYDYFNPPLPWSIVIHELDGTTTYTY